MLIPSRHRSKIDAAIAFAVLLFGPRTAEAQLRLRGDALAETSSPVGLLVLRGEDRVQPWLDAETVTWLGTATGGDVLTLTVRARHARSGSELRVGRFVANMGALRPVHIDGARAVVRPGGRSIFEGFAGVPVVSSFAYRQFDWTAGGRIGQSFGDVASIGGAYALRKRASSVDDEEAGLDFGFTPAKWLTAAGRSTFDVTTRGVAEALASVSAQSTDMRGELFLQHRSPARFLSKTSLFSVLGDVPATSYGATARWQMFPRLEAVASGSVQTRDQEIGGQGFARATLALDDARDGTLGLEARRVDFAGGRWAGARALASFPIRWALRLATEVELVRPDTPRGGPALWPWGLVAISWRAPRGWEVATAVEASAGRDRSSVNALARFSYAFDQAARP